MATVRPSRSVKRRDRLAHLLGVPVPALEPALNVARVPQAFAARPRDPVERALSRYAHERRLGFEKLPLAEALTAEHERLAGEIERMARDPSNRSVAHQHSPASSGACMPSSSSAGSR
jgi:hypothetical protein